MTVLWTLFVAVWACNPAQVAGKETTFICTHAFAREIPERYPDEDQCNRAADKWKRDSRADLLLMNTANCVPVAGTEVKKK
jgi:hypothetical protein